MVTCLGDPWQERGRTSTASAKGRRAENVVGMEILVVDEPVSDDDARHVRPKKALRLRRRDICGDGVMGMAVGVGLKLLL